MEKLTCTLVETIAFDEQRIHFTSPDVDVTLKVKNASLFNQYRQGDTLDSIVKESSPEDFTALENNIAQLQAEKDALLITIQQLLNPPPVVTITGAGDGTGHSKAIPTSL